jgi:DNA polymerase III delta subunit
MAPELRPVYLIGGSDRPKVELAVERLRDRFDAAAVEILSAAEATGPDAVAACNALGLFGSGHRLVLVQDVERWKVEDAKAIGEYVNSPAPDTVLALVADEVRKDSSLAKACAKAGEVLVYEVQRRDLVRWLGDQLGRRQAKADPAALRALVATAGDDPAVLASEVDKLATWANGEEIDVAAVETLAAAVAPPIWSLTDATSRLSSGRHRSCSSTARRLARAPSRVSRTRSSIRFGSFARARLCVSRASVRPKPPSACAARNIPRGRRSISPSASARTSWQRSWSGSPSSTSPSRAGPGFPTSSS